MDLCICKISLELSIGRNRIFGLGGALVVFAFLLGYDCFYMNLAGFAVT